MSFGMMNALTHFMYLVNSFFMSEMDKSVMGFIDDILVYSKSLVLWNGRWFFNVVLQTILEQDVVLLFGLFYVF
jgi:hypothetical protein